MLTQPEHTYESGPPVPYRSPDAILRIDDNKLSELIEDFYEDKTDATQKAYRKDVKHFAEFLNVDSSGAVAKAFLGHGQGNANWTVMRFKKFMIKGQLAPATINRRLSSLRSFANFSQQMGMTPWDLSIKSVKQRKYKDTRGPSIENVRKMAAAIEAYDSPRKERDRLIFRLTFILLLRRNAVAKLELSDFDQATNSLWYLPKGHSEKKYKVIPDAVLTALNDWIALRGSEPGPLIYNLVVGNRGGCGITGIGIWKIIKRIGKEVGINVWPHAMRHAGITVLCNLAATEGHSLKDVQEAADHASLQTTMIYWDKANSQQGKMSSLLERSLAM